MSSLLKGLKAREAGAVLGSDKSSTHAPAFSPLDRITRGNCWPWQSEQLCDWFEIISRVGDIDRGSVGARRQLLCNVGGKLGYDSW